MIASDNDRTDNGAASGTFPDDTQAVSGSDTASSAATPEQDAQRPNLRQLLRTRRDSLSEAVVARNSQLIAAQLQPLLQDAGRIAGYLAFGKEVNVEQLLADCRARHSTTFVPLIQSDHTLLFSPLDDSTVIVQNRYGIREPVYESRDCIAPMALDVVLVPLLGFDPHCHRMGMGGGYYDRSFTHRRHPAPTASPEQSTTPLLIGVAHQLQCVDNISTQWWDVPLDMVVTESRIYRRNSE